MWTIDQVWNESFKLEPRKVEARDYLWATDLGKSDIDIILKLQGKQPSNPLDDRVLRKMEAGKIWEFIIKSVLLRAGVLKEEEKRIEYQGEGLMRVSGKLDILAGGVPQYSKALEDFRDGFYQFLPEGIKNASEAIIKHLAEKFPNGLDEQPFEVKSVASTVFNQIEATNKPKKMHSLQLFHYVFGGNMQQGVLTYICRDSARIISFVISASDEELKNQYFNKIEKITDYYRSNELPPIEPLIVFDEDLKKFVINWQIIYSDYLTELYGFAHSEEYRKQIGSKATSWNRVMNRIVNKDKMTKSNEEYIEEIKTHFSNFDELVNLFAESKVTDEAEGEPENADV